MKNFILTITLAFAAIMANAQTATDFTATDCKGVSHHLFSELDNGKVVVLISVMPCPMCISGGGAGYSAVQSFATSHPGKVVYYLVDDFGDNTCNDLAAWANTNGIDTSKTSIFDNSGNVISMLPYGGAAMPRIIVLGGTSHHVFYNQHDGAANDMAGIKSAINDAIALVGVKKINNQSGVNVSPNPTTNNILISNNVGIGKVIISAITGKIVTEMIAGGNTNITVDMSGIVKGIYILNIIDVNGMSYTQKIVKE